MEIRPPDTDKKQRPMRGLCTCLGEDRGKIFALVVLLCFALSGCARGVPIAEHGALAVFAVLLVMLISGRTAITHGGRVTVSLILLVVEVIASLYGIRSAELMSLSTLAVFLIFVAERHRPRSS